METRSLLRILSLAVAATLAPGASAQSETYPNRPVRFVVSFSPGGSVDTTGRLLAAALGERWKQAVVVENRPGADGNIAAESVIRSPADGYTLLVTSNSLSITPALRKVPFDSARDLAAITRVLSIPNLLVVTPSLPAKNVAELVAIGKSRPDSLSFASSGTGTTPFMGMALLQTMTGARFVHVPYKGTAPAVTATLGGETQLMFGDVNSTLPHVRAGKFRAIGISSAQRSDLVPEVPTLAEGGLASFETSTWVGVLGPAGLPKNVVESVHGAIVDAMKGPAMQERFRAMGAMANGEGPVEFARIVQSDIERWTKVVRELGVKPE